MREPSMQGRWSPAYIGLGSNLGDPPAQILAAHDRLCRDPDVDVRILSALWRSAPLGPADQPDYCNAVSGVLVRCRPHEVLEKLLEVERSLGRTRDGTRWGPRVIDLDLLVMPGCSSDDETLKLPHPEMLKRAFVMTPLAEVAPHLPLADGRSAEWHARRLGHQGLRPWAAVAATA